jgi:hypothetical protein
MITSWFSQLDRSRTPGEVIATARDFVATLTPGEMKLLPPDCRPGKLRDEADIEALHSTLVEAYRSSRATGPELETLQRLTSFVVRASIRLAELGASGSSGAASGAAGGPERSLAPPEN